jgi:hypothetical protein
MVSPPTRSRLANSPPSDDPHGGTTGSSAHKAIAGSPADLTALATKLGHPICWNGRKAGYSYKLTREADGKVFIRYVPPGVEVGAKEQYLTIGTHPFAGAFDAVKRVATEQKVENGQVARIG